MTPIQETFEFVVQQFDLWRTTLLNPTLFGVKFIYYFVGFIILDVVIDYVFR